MKTKLLAVLLLACASAFAAPRVFVGVGFGYRPAYPMYRAYVPAPVVAYAAPVPAYYAPPMPGPGYAGIGGWGAHAGYWARRPFVGAAWVGPRNFGGRYYAGHWRR